MAQLEEQWLARSKTVDCVVQHIVCDKVTFTSSVILPKNLSESRCD